MQYFWLGLFLFFWDHIYVLKIEHCNFGWLCVTGSSWVERVTVRKNYQLGLYQPADLPVKGSNRWRQKDGVFCPLHSEWAAYGAGRDQRVCSSRMILTTELQRKMWSVNAVIWLCNATDCSGSGKVTYLLGWHDWPMSAHVWRQASFWSAAAQLCPWAVLVPVQKPGDSYVPFSAYSLYPEKFLIYSRKTYLAHTVNIGVQIHEVFLLVRN